MRLGYINGLRALAIISVIWHHLSFGILSKVSLDILWGTTLQPFPVLTELWKGVDLFFILSGFVLYLPFFLKKRQMTNRLDAKHFYIRRAQRLIPIFILVFLVIYSIQHKYPVSSPRFYMELIGVPTLAFQFSNLGFMPPSFGPLWSVGLEILFSAIFPVVLLFRARYPWRWLLSGSLILSLAVQFSANFFVWRSLQQGLPAHLLNFLIGMVACEITLTPEAFPRVDAAITKASPFFPAGMLIALLMLDVRGATAVHIAGNLLFSLSSGGLLVAIGTGRAKRLRAVLEVRWLQVIGAMCYSIYLWHVPILLGLFPGFPNIAWQDFVPYAPLYLALTLAISALSYRYIEFPKADFRTLFLINAPKAFPAAMDFVGSISKPQVIRADPAANSAQADHHVPDGRISRSAAPS